jgi:hypothetical protein
MVRVTIRGEDNIAHETTAMIDCGASENFIDKRYAEKNNIPLREKNVPCSVLAVDGREVSSGPVTHDTTVNMTINDHQEMIKFHCINIGNAPIIVGLPWLRKHNPDIDWKESRVTFSSEKCANECLAASPHATTVPEKQATVEYFEDVPLDGTLEELHISMADCRRRNRGNERKSTMSPGSLCLTLVGMRHATYKRRECGMW